MSDDSFGESKTSVTTQKEYCKLQSKVLDSQMSHLCDQIRVADNGSHKETVVSNLCAHLHTGCTQVQVHLVVGAWDGS